jgi:hypothetical protein
MRLGSSLAATAEFPRPETLTAFAEHLPQEWIERAAQDGFPNYSLVEADPNLERARAVPSFRDFVARLRQDWEHLPGEMD